MEDGPSMKVGEGLGILRPEELEGKSSPKGGFTHGNTTLIFGTLYPAYYSYKAVKSKDIKEYVKWMMYWIIFALFTTAETFTDIFLSWFPFYYELKIAFVAWLLSPYTKGSSLLYRKFVHPTLSSKEKEIDDCLVQAKDRSYDALVHFGKRGLNVAATAAVMAASKVTAASPGDSIPAGSVAVSYRGRPHLEGERERMRRGSGGGKGGKMALFRRPGLLLRSR
uniref:Receptor expression-enhancing protein n=1 Tax=Ornithorhynchus anatinus TaxID=9258 RepID=F6YM36_ORNAN